MSKVLDTITLGKVVEDASKQYRGVVADGHLTLDQAQAEQIGEAVELAVLTELEERQRIQLREHGFPILAERVGFKRITFDETNLSREDRLPLATLRMAQGNPTTEDVRLLAEEHFNIDRAAEIATREAMTAHRRRPTPQPFSRLQKVLIVGAIFVALVAVLLIASSVRADSPCQSVCLTSSSTPAAATYPSSTITASPQASQTTSSALVLSKGKAQSALSATPTRLLAAQTNLAATQNAAPVECSNGRYMLTMKSGVNVRDAPRITLQTERSNVIQGLKTGETMGATELIKEGATFGSGAGSFKVAGNWYRTITDAYISATVVNVSCLASLTPVFTSTATPTMAVTFQPKPTATPLADCAGPICVLVNGQTVPCTSPCPLFVYVGGKP